MVRMMKMIVDYSEETPHDHLIRNNQLQLCFSILNHLGWKGDYQTRHFRSKLAMTALNLRNIVILITIAHNQQGTRGATTPMDDAGKSCRAER
jgi:mediator of RNA polymerase II transcription subunit 16, fungi type